MEIFREGKKIVLTSAELLTAYQEQKHAYRLEDAERQLKIYLGLDESVQSEDELEDNRKDAEAKYCVSVENMLNPEFGILDEIIEEFTDDFDCNRDENGIWADACDCVLQRYLV